jgi:hypothetical protein
MKTAIEIREELKQFYGTEMYHKISILPNMLATDGVAWLAKNAECFWLTDEITIAQSIPEIKRNTRLQEMQFWTLRKKSETSAELICEEDEGQTVYMKRIHYTDFPLDSIRIWVAPVDEKTKVMMLPSEY